MIDKVIRQALALYVLNYQRERCATILANISERAELRRTDREYR